MAEKKEEKIVLEREYIIPLRREWVKVPRYRRTERAIKAIRTFVMRHMKLYCTEQEAKKLVKIGRWLNEELWSRGIRKPPAKVHVKAKKYADNRVEVELEKLPPAAAFEAARLEKKAKEKKVEKKVEEKKPEPKPEEAKAEEKKEEEKAKEEITKKEVKVIEKKVEHKEKIAEPKKPKKHMMHRMALEK